MLLTNLSIATMAKGDGLIDRGAILIENGRIQWVGPASDLPPTQIEPIDCGGRLLTPGLIDCHTHLVYGGSRAEDFEMGLQGASYAEIAQAGGGIMSTVRATRAASEEELIQSALKRLDCLLSEGVTTLEIKSGYGLDVETEVKMLRVARQLGRLRPVDIKTTFLGAHIFPEEFKNRPEEYVALVCRQALPRVVSEGLADAVDAFCDTMAFSVKETEAVFQAAKGFNLPVKLHAEQFSNLGGAKLAAQYQALSVDHIEYLDEAGVECLAKAGCVAVLLPGAFYYLHEKQAPPIASLRRHQVPMAIATDLNPGSSPIHSLLAVMNMGCVLFGLTPEEVLRGVTVHAALALGLHDRGTIAKGQKADLALWDAERPADLVYRLGYNPLYTVIRNGEVVRGELG